MNTKLLLITVVVGVSAQGVSAMQNRHSALSLPRPNQIAFVDGAQPILAPTPMPPARPMHVPAPQHQFAANPVALRDLDEHLVEVDARVLARRAEALAQRRALMAARNAKTCGY